ncbi:sigma-70 family RNA polymerase sigma factor [Noviherbaspirillum sedimenti]|uniref:Sigma-70 family RNA polymerase sigma factor n=1 Tax=Noviherbaspirillum sedimenti TaxID=2320865 RepID=A0A3A3G3C5_9BURK|nr:sigma-70 family RNA polymerase sigma factor [Noviherbaspirillum sedimenti]RJG02354.1 sigma-70 family RNA polymerase sigma factor [Noviherbaspirillum sedimenti]
MLDFSQELALQIPRLRRYARALTHNAAWADDLVQDTLERALRRRWLFRLQSNLTAWLMTILYRLYLNEAARYRKAQEMQAAQLPEPVGRDEHGWQIDMQRALARLSVEHRAVIVLVGLEQVSYQEAAEILGVPPGTIMSRLARARSQLRAILSGQVDASAAPVHLSRIK